MPEPNAATELTAGQVIDLYLPEAKRELAPRGYLMAADILGRFKKAIGDKPVTVCRAFDLQCWINANPQWKSDWTILRVIRQVKACFNWAERMELIVKNPFRGIRHRTGARGRPMTEEEFRTLLRNTDASFRRVLLFLWLTGARPGELAGLRWEHIDLQRGAIVLPVHKTSRKTGKPRVIPLTPTLVKLLVWIRTHWQVSTRELTIRYLAAGPLRAKELITALHRHGISNRMAYQARKGLGVQRRKGSDGELIFSLPAERTPTELSNAEHVFINWRGEAWTRNALSLRMQRLRGRTGLPRDCKLYGARHAFGSRAILRGVNLKVLSTLMGHTTTAMTEYYVAVAGDVDHLRSAMEQVQGHTPAGTAADGPVGLKSLTTIPIPAPIVIPMPPPAEQVVKPIWSKGKRRPAVPVHASAPSTASPSASSAPTNGQTAGAPPVHGQTDQDNQAKDTNGTAKPRGPKTKRRKKVAQILKALLDVLTEE